MVFGIAVVSSDWFGCCWNLVVSSILVVVVWLVVVAEDFVEEAVIYMMLVWVEVIISEMWVRVEETSV